MRKNKDNRKFQIKLELASNRSHFSGIFAFLTVSMRASPKKLNNSLNIPSFFIIQKRLYSLHDGLYLSQRYTLTVKCGKSFERKYAHSQNIETLFSVTVYLSKETKYSFHKTSRSCGCAIGSTLVDPQPYDIKTTNIVCVIFI